MARHARRDRGGAGGFLPLDTVYAFDPVPPALTPAQAAHVLGGQGQVWTEYIRHPKDVEYMAFHARLEQHLARLRILDVNYRPLRP